MAAILKNGNNFWTINARCMQLALVESSHDFEQLLFQAFFFYLYKKYGQGQFYICNMRLWRPAWKMAITFEPLTLDACHLVLVESSYDFEQLLFQAFFSYLFKK